MDDGENNLPQHAKFRLTSNNSKHCATSRLGSRSNYTSSNGSNVPAHSQTSSTPAPGAHETTHPESLSAVTSAHSGNDAPIPTPVPNGKGNGNGTHTKIPAPNGKGTANLGGAKPSTQTAGDGQTITRFEDAIPCPPYHQRHGLAFPKNKEQWKPFYIHCDERRTDVHFDRYKCPYNCFQCGHHHPGVECPEGDGNHSKSLFYVIGLSSSKISQT